MHQLLVRCTILHRRGECGNVMVRRAECGALLGVAAGILAWKLLACTIKITKGIACSDSSLQRKGASVGLRRYEALALRIKVLTLVASRQRVLSVAGGSSREGLAGQLTVLIRLMRVVHMS